MRPNRVKPRVVNRGDASVERHTLTHEFQQLNRRAHQRQMRDQRFAPSVAVLAVRLHAAAGNLDQLARLPQQNHAQKAQLGRAVQRKADKVAHLHRLHAGEKRRRSRLALTAENQPDFIRALLSADRKLQSDRFLERFFAHRMHHARRAQHGQPSDHAQPGVERPFRQFLAAGDADCHLRRARGENLPNRLLDHPPRHGVDRRLADGQLHARQGDRPHAVARQKADAAVALHQPNACADLTPGGDIRVVAAALDDPADIAAVRDDLRRKRFARRNDDPYALGACAVPLPETARQRCRRRAAPRREALAKRLHRRYPRGVSIRPKRSCVSALPMSTVVNISSGSCTSSPSVSTRLFCPSRPMFCT